MYYWCSICRRWVPEEEVKADVPRDPFHIADGANTIHTVVPPVLAPATAPPSPDDERQNDKFIIKDEVLQKPIIRVSPDNMLTFDLNIFTPESLDRFLCYVRLVVSDVTGNPLSEELFGRLLAKMAEGKGGDTDGD